MGRKILHLKTGWAFSRSDDPACRLADYDDASWERVRVPHDWAISGPFDRENDIQDKLKQVADVPDRVQLLVARTGGLPHIGVGWYRKKITVPAERTGQRVRLEIDGAMSRSEVYCNGEIVGGWPYGYSSFALDLTKFIRPGAENLIAVRLENPGVASRWYPGAGLYRHVRLVFLNPVHVAHWGTCVTTPDVTDASASVHLSTMVENHGAPAEATLVSTIRDAGGRVVAKAETSHPVAGTHEFVQDLRVVDPRRWMPGQPNLYAITTEVLVEGDVVDTCETPLGFRTLVFDPDRGFQINGVPMKLNGVCLHHDLGPLGAAVNRTALQRQLRIMQDMGCNAIRTSHNPPAPELLDLCDAMGLLVIDEAFDEWKDSKMENGYHKLFDEWAEKDLRAMIRRDRNHPSVIMWSIGNEIHEQWIEGGGKVAEFLCRICHDEDPTRPTTAGFNSPEMAIKNGLAAAVDIPGWNYQPGKYVRYHQLFPTKATYGSETESTVSSRGEYYFPVNEEVGLTRETFQVNSYDMSYPGWAYSPDVEFRAQDECPFILGEFVWTGFDYLGEPTPYHAHWPSRSSYFGIVDLCGLPKDRFYLYQSKWTDKRVLHLLPHWTWPGREGESTPVHCYTSFPAVELFVNGISQGRRSKRVHLMMGSYRLVWPDVRYAPGELKAVAYDADGKAAAETVVHTAGSPASVELKADRDAMVLDGEDMAFVTVRILDADGNLCPRADNLVKFVLEGDGEIAAVDNGNAASLEPFIADERKAFNGLCMVYLRSREGEGGTVTLRAHAEGLSSAAATLRGVPPEKPAIG